MQGCKNDTICKHFVLTSFTECLRKDICKFYAEGDKAIGGGSAEKPKRHYKRRAKPDSDDDGDITESAITEKQFKKARKKLDRLERLGKLDENQIKALESYKGKHYKTLTDVQRQQIVSMAKGK